MTEAEQIRAAQAEFLRATEGPPRRKATKEEVERFAAALRAIGTEHARQLAEAVGQTQEPAAVELLIGRQTIADDVLRKFLSSDHGVLKDILTLWNLRGDGTQTDADRMRAAIGDQAYEHYNWDTAVSNGRVLLVLPRFKHPAGVRAPFGFHFPAEWFWCFEQIEMGEDVEPASVDAVGRVPEELRESVAVLPGVEWMTVRRVNFFNHDGRGAPKRKHQAPPEGIQFFKFHGGVGLSVARRD